MKGLEHKIQILDKLINFNTNLMTNSNCDGVKKSYETFIQLLLNQKIKIQQTIDDFKSKKEFEQESKKLLKNISR